MILFFETLSADEQERVRIKILPEDEMVVSFAKQMNASFIFRGIRDFIDLKYENELNLVQKKIDPSIETVFFLTPRDKIEISSSMIKSTTCLKKWEMVVKDYIPTCVLEALKAKRDV